MIVHCKYDELVSINDLTPHEYSRNKHPDDQIKRLAKVLLYQGWRYPVKVSNRSGQVTSGHGRMLAAKENGWSEVPVNYQDYESFDQEYADVQSDNAVANWSELDLSGINSDIGGLGPDFDLELLGIKEFSLDPDFSPATEDEQGRLDQTKTKILECPHCHEKFEEKQANTID